MPPKGFAIAMFTGGLAIFLGFSSLLDQLVRGLRNVGNVMGTPQPVTPQREPEELVSRFDRLCFVAGGAIVILIGLLAAILKH